MIGAILHAQSLLFQELRTDPRLALAALSGWLDPLPFAPPGIDDWDSQSEEAYLANALHVCRTCFPDVYAEALALLRSGLEQAAVERAMCKGMNTHLIAQLYDLEGIPHGVPCECVGIDWNTHYGGLEDYESRLVAIADAFGVPDRPIEAAAPTARALSEDLHTYEEGTIYADLDCLLQWMFAFSGNTLVDYDEESFYESGIEPLDWTRENVEFVNFMQQEANDFVTAAGRALAVLESDEAWMQALKVNIERVERRKKGDPRRLDWPKSPGGGASDAADLAA